MQRLGLLHLLDNPPSYASADVTVDMGVHGIDAQGRNASSGDGVLHTRANAGNGTETIVDTAKGQLQAAHSKSSETARSNGSAASSAADDHESVELRDNALRINGAKTTAAQASISVMETIERNFHEREEEKTGNDMSEMKGYGLSSSPQSRDGADVPVRNLGERSVDRESLSSSETRTRSSATAAAAEARIAAAMRRQLARAKEDARLIEEPLRDRLNVNILDQIRHREPQCQLKGRHEKQSDSQHLMNHLQLGRQESWPAPKSVFHGDGDPKISSRPLRLASPPSSHEDVGYNVNDIECGHTDETFFCKTSENIAIFQKGKDTNKSLGLISTPQAVARNDGMLPSLSKPAMAAHPGNPCEQVGEAPLLTVDTSQQLFASPEPRMALSSLNLLQNSNADKTDKTGTDLNLQTTTASLDADLQALFGEVHQGDEADQDAVFNLIDNGITVMCDHGDQKRHGGDSSLRNPSGRNDCFDNVVEAKPKKIHLLAGEDIQSKPVPRSEMGAIEAPAATMKRRKRAFEDVNE